MDKEQDKWWGRIVVALLVAIVGLAFYCLHTGKNIDAVSVVVAALILKLGTLLDFRYGSSAGSKEKTEMLNAKNN